jgi:hypothetical protein
MKKIVVGLVVALGIGLGGLALAHYGGHGSYGGHMMGPGYGDGGHMMGPGYGDHRWEGTPATDERTGSITEKEAAFILKNYIGANPNLKVGEIKDKGTYFEGEIITKKDSLVAKLSIDKTTGWVQPLY